MPDMTTEKPLFTWFLLALTSVVAGIFALQLLNDYDVWWHLRTGQWIVEHRAFPQTDPFSFATADAAWPNFVYWLSDPLFYLLYQAGGINGLLIFKAVVIAAAAAGLFLFVVRRGLPPFWGATLLLWVVYVARFRFTLRPLIFKFAGVVFLFWFFYEKVGGRWRYPLFFLAVLLWTWLYPAAFLAQLFALFLLVEKLVERLCKAQRYQAGELGDAAILVALSTLALLLSPSGLDYFTSFYGGMSSDYLAGTNVVEEHQPLVWSAQPAFAGLCLLAAASFVPARRTARLLSVLIFLAFVVLAAGSVRYVGVAAFALAGVIGVNLGGSPFWAAPRLQRLAAPRWLRLAGIAGLLGLSLLLWKATFAKDRVYQFGVGVNPSRYPYAAVQILNDMQFAGNIYNTWEFGGFLQWTLPAARTFIDGRCLPAQLELFQRFLSIDLRSFADYLADNQVKAALLSRRSARDVQYFNQLPGYRLVHMDDLAMLFLRNDLAGPARPAAPAQYRYLRLGGYDFEYLRPLATGAEAAAVEAEIRAALQTAPDNFFVNFLLAFYYDVRGDRRAAAQYAKAAGFNPNFSHTHFQIGIRGGSAALRSGDWALAEQIIDDALAYQQNAMLYFLLGGALQQQGKLDAAETAYRRSLALEESPQTLNNAGFLLIDAGKPRDAIGLFEKILQSAVRTHDEQALYGLALAYRKLNEQGQYARYRDLLGERYPGSALRARLQ